METPRAGIGVGLNGVLAAFLLALRRLRRSKFFAANLVVAAIPLLIAVLAVIFREAPAADDVQLAHFILENTLRTYYLHFLVFFIAGISGFAVIRQELDDKTLHYLLLQPVGRWALILGKLLAALLLSAALCVASFWLYYSIYMLRWFGIAAYLHDLLRAGRGVILLQESGVIVLGLLAYCSIAILMGSFFKTGSYALFLLGWESALPYLPSELKLWTVMHYLHSLLPVRLHEQRQLFELLGAPASTGASLLALCGVALVTTGLTIFLFYFRECNYGDV